MKYKAIACPAPYRGQTGFGPSTVVPDQSMSLQEILERFTRNQPVAVGKETYFDEEGDEDLEKLARKDLTEKAEFVEKQKATRRRYDEQEKRKQKEREEKMRDEERAKIRQEEKEKAGKSAGKAE